MAKKRQTPEGLSLSSGLFCRERQQRNVSGTFDGNGQLTLMFCTGTGNPARQDLAPFGDELAQLGCIFIIDFLDFVDAEGADFSSGSPISSFTLHHSYSLSSLLEWDLFVKTYFRAKAPHGIGGAALRGMILGRRILLACGRIAGAFPFDEFHTVRNDFRHIMLVPVFAIVAADLQSSFHQSPLALGQTVPT